MARTVVGYEGKGRSRRAIYQDHGPARGRAGGTGDSDALSKLGAQVVPSRFLTGDSATTAERGGHGAIERRQATDAQRAAWAAERAAQAPTTPAIAPKYQLALEAARKAQARQPAPVTAPPSLEEGSVVASPAPVLKRDGVAVLAPCADCSHSAVCSIRPTLAGKGLDADFSSSIPGVRVVAVSLECSFFLPNGSTNAGTIGRYEAPHDDVVAALIALGYSTTEARRLAAAAPGATVEDRLRAALRGLVTETPVDVARRLSPVDRLTDQPRMAPSLASTNGASELPDGLTKRMAEVLDVVRASGGNMAAAARTLNVDTATVRQIVLRVRARGFMPVDIAAMLDARARDRQARESTARA